MCLLKGNRLNKRETARMCDIKVANRNGKKVWVTAEPTCTRGLKVRVIITAKKGGATKNTWRKTWRVKAQPRHSLQFARHRLRLPLQSGRFC